jgi:hypothetical protein
MGWTGNIAPMEERRDVYRFMVEKPEGKRPFAIRRRR